MTLLPAPHRQLVDEIRMVAPHPDPRTASRLAERYGHQDVGTGVEPERSELDAGAHLGHGG